MGGAPTPKMAPLVLTHSDVGLGVLEGFRCRARRYGSWGLGAGTHKEVTRGGMGPIMDEVTKQTPSCPLTQNTLVGSLWKPMLLDRRVYRRFVSSSLGRACKRLYPAFDVMCSSVTQLATLVMQKLQTAPARHRCRYPPLILYWVFGFTMLLSSFDCDACQACISNHPQDVSQSIESSLWFWSVLLCASNRAQCHSHSCRSNTYSRQSTAVAMFITCQLVVA